MARLTCEAGTVVTADGDLEGRLRDQGWTDVDQAPAEKRKPGRPRKTESE